MEKYLFLLSAFLFTTYLAQAQSIKYFDNDWNETTKEKSSYYRKLPLQKVGELLLLKDYHNNGELQFQGYIYPQDENEYVGDGYWYDEHGFDLNSVQYLNRSTQKELSYYTKTGTLYKKILYNAQGQKSKIVLYDKDKIIATGVIEKDEFSGYFSPNRPEYVYRINKIDKAKDKQDGLEHLPIYSIKNNNIYFDVIYWENGKKASEEKKEGYKTKYKKYWNEDGKEIYNDLVNKKPDISLHYYTKNGLAVTVKEKKETYYTNNIFTAITTEYNEKGKITRVTKEEDRNLVEEKFYADGKEKVLKYVDKEPFDGAFDYTIGNFNPIFTMVNGKIIGEAITKDVKTNAVITRGNYKDGLPNDGTFFSKKNNRIILSSYKNQKQDGLQQIFDNHWNPKLIESFEMKNGKRNGVYKKYLKNDSVRTMVFKNDLPFSGVFEDGDDLMYYTDGNLIKIDKFGKNGGISSAEFYENNKIASTIYFDFSIADDPQEIYKGVFKDEQPYNGYFIGEAYFDDFPTITFYENGTLKYKYYGDILQQMNQNYRPLYSKKGTYKDGERIDGFEYMEIEGAGLLGTAMKNGKLNFLELNLFAMHYFNRYIFELNDGILRINELQNGISIKASTVNKELLVELFDVNNTLITSNTSSKVTEGAPNSHTIFKYVDHKLIKEFRSFNSLAELGDRNDDKIETLLFVIYSYLVVNGSKNLDDTLKKFAKNFKDMYSRNIYYIFNDQDSILQNDNDIGILTYDEKGTPYMGMNITEDTAGFKLEFYVEGKKTNTKQVKSVDEIKKAMNSWYEDLESH